MELKGVLAVGLGPSKIDLTASAFALSPLENDSMMSSRKALIPGLAELGLGLTPLELAAVSNRE
jgi:hypothetical protein